MLGEQADPGDDSLSYYERVLYGPRLMRLKQHRPWTYPGEVTLLANHEWLRHEPALGWGPPAVARLHLHELPGDHEGHMQDNANSIGSILRSLLDELDAAD